MKLLDVLNVDASDEEYRLVMDRMVADGRLAIIGKRDGEPVYALTEKGRRYADEQLAEAGVTLEEATAVAYEHATEALGRGLTVRQVADFGPRGPE